MKIAESPYYPRRASRLSSVRDRWQWWVGRAHWAFPAIEVPQGLSWTGFLGSVFVPGLGIYLRGKPRLGRLAMGACGALWLIFFLWLGYPVSNFAFGMVLSVQVTSLLYYLGPILQGTRLAYRILLSFIVIGAFLTFLYLPCQAFLQDHFFRPLVVRGKVVVIYPCSSRAVHRGDWVAYLLDGQFDRTVYLRAGLALGPVLAKPGDRVCFRGTGFEVGGVVRPLAQGMPTEGEWHIPPETVMVWPDLDISVRGQVTTANIHGALQQLSMVSTYKLVGKPFTHWFWRRQTPSP